MKMFIWSGMKKAAPIFFFTVYNGYCNLSRYFGYQSVAMKRSGMKAD